MTVQLEQRLAAVDVRFLYHGTSERHLDAILRRGLVPRRRRRGVRSNWTHTVTSNPNTVYLTTAYAGYFAMNAAADGERWLVVEIAMDRLDPALVLPDEDFLEQCSRGSADADAAVIGGKSMERRTRFYRDRVHDYAEHWAASLENLGTVGHYGTIEPSMITRVSLFDPSSNRMQAWGWCDPSITPLNYVLMGAKYRAMTRWLFDADVAPEDIDPFLAVGSDDLQRKRRAAMEESLAERSGVEVRDVAT